MEYLSLLLIINVSIVLCCSSSDWINCTNVRNHRCSVSRVLDVTHPSHNICVMVNASNPFGDAASNETCVNLQDVSKCIALLLVVHS